jgi:hypothetical protein
MSNLTQEAWRPRRGRSVAAPLLAVAVSILLVSFLVASVSRAAFIQTADNSANVVGAGTIDLVDNDSGSVLFNVSTLVPGDTVENCIVVTYQGTVADPAAVKLYSGGFTDSGDFADFLNITIEEGSGGTFNNCTGFTSANVIESGGTLTGFDTTHSSYATGAGVWDPSGTPESVTYKVTFELDSATTSAEEGEAVSDLIFTWEVQS